MKGKIIKVTHSSMYHSMLESDQRHKLTLITWERITVEIFYFDVNIFIFLNFIKDFFTLLRLNIMMTSFYLFVVQTIDERTFYFDIKQVVKGTPVLITMTWYEIWIYLLLLISLMYSEHGLKYSSLFSVDRFFFSTYRKILEPN